MNQKNSDLDLAQTQLQKFPENYSNGLGIEPKKR